MGSFEWLDHNFWLEIEDKGLVTPTFLRLDEERRDQVIEAVLAESAKSGPERINIKEVAKSSRVPIGSLYQYFGDRERLSRFATLLVMRKLGGELEGYLPYLEALPLREALILYLKSGVEWGVQEAASFRAFLAAAYGGSADDWYLDYLVRPLALSFQRLMRRLVAAAGARGELKKGIDIDTAADLANVLIIAVGDARLVPALDEYYRLYTDGSSLDARIEAAVDFICRSILNEVSV
jgi:AcrR family transcriptional regulator